MDQDGSRDLVAYSFVMNVTNIKDSWQERKCINREREGGVKRIWSRIPVPETSPEFNHPFPPGEQAPFEGERTVPM